MLTQKKSLALLALLMLTLPFVSSAKDGVHARFLTPVPEGAAAGERLDLEWTLVNKDDARPFDACNVFVRLISATGETSEAMSRCGGNPPGHYSANIIVPTGGIERVEVGVAGTMTMDGVSSRRDWMMPLAASPFERR